MSYEYTGDGQLNCSSSDSSVATCDIDTENKVVNINSLSIGSVTITVTASESETYSSTSSVIELLVTEAELDDGSVVIEGTNTYGQTLTAVVTDTEPKADYSYQWYYSETNSTEDGTIIEGATSSTYTIGDGTTGKYIYVVVSAKKDYYAVKEFSDITDESNGTETVAMANATLNVTSGYYFYYPDDVTISYTYIGDGELTCTSSDSSIATCEITASGSITVISHDGGTATITLSASQGIGYYAISKNISVTITRETYIVSYDANGGSGAPESQIKTYGSDLTLSDEVPTRDGYVFLGWSTSPTATSATYDAGGVFTVNESTILYAVWEGLTAYAVYSADDESLTFFRTAEAISTGSTYNGRTVTAFYTGFEEETYSSYLLVPWYDYRDSITIVYVENTISPVSTAYWFYGLVNCTYMSLYDLDTSHVSDMSYMFYKTGYSVTESFHVNLSDWDTSNVTDMNHMFYETGYSATEWYIGDLSTREVTGDDGGTYTAWDTSSVTDMSSMFSNAGYSATTFELIGLDSWATPSVTNLSSMFSNAGYNATNWYLDLSSWDTSNVTDMSSMFEYAGYNATEWYIGDLNNWVTWNVTDMSSMFEYAGYSVGNTWYIGDLSSWDTSNVTNMSSMFEYAGYNATEWNIGDLNNWITSNVTDMSYMFSNAGYSATNWYLYLGSWDVSNVTSYIDFALNVDSKISAPAWV